METTLTTKDNHNVAITHASKISEVELEAMRRMTLRELFQVGSIKGIKLED